jgi:hypothetical protein
MWAHTRALLARPWHVGGGEPSHAAMAVVVVVAAPPRPVAAAIVAVVAVVVVVVVAVVHWARVTHTHTQGAAEKQTVPSCQSSVSSRSA